MKKKLFSVALIALVSFSLVGCDELDEFLDDLETPDETETVPSDSESSETDPSESTDTETPEHTHNYEITSSVEPTCTEEGSNIYTCECGETYTETIEALGHDYVLTDTIEPTCGEEGSKEYTCSRCDATYTETLEATGEHTWDSGEVTKPATCTEAGETTYTCTTCESTKTEPIEALGHDFDGGTYAHDDTYHWKKCSRCEVEDTNKVEHTWNDGEITTEASCTEAGSKTYTCTVCGVTKEDEISATGHSWGEWTAVTGADTHTRSCSNCDATETKDHEWGSGVVTKSATCTEQGVRTYTCSVCGATKTEDIDALGHTLGSEYYGKGEAWYQYCSVCASYVVVNTPTEAASFTVSDETSLVTAISLGGTITFANDICISKTLALCKDATLDLAGHKLYNETDCYLGNDIITNGCSLLSIRGDISVTITGDGTFDSKENDCFAIDISKGGAASNAEKGPEVTIESGTYIGNIDSIYVCQGELTILDGYFSVKQLYNNSRQWTLNIEDAYYRNGEASIILYGGSYEGFDPSASYSEATLPEGYYSWETGTTEVNGSTVSIYTVEYTPFAYDTPALFGFDVSGTTNYITGGLIGSYTYEGAITTSRNEAAWVSLSRGDGSNGYYMTFDDNGVTKYICIEDVNDYQDLQYETKATMIYWNSEHECWTNEAGTYFLCYNSAYKCLYGSEITGWINSSPIAQFYGLVAPTSLTISGETSVASNRSITLSVTANEGADNFVTWSSSDENTAKVDQNGVVSGVAEGDATIYATSKLDPSVVADYSITVTEASQELVEYSISITPESLAAEYGKTVSDQADISQGTPTSTYADGAVTVTWTGGGTGIKPWTSTSTLPTSIRIYASAKFTVKDGTASVSRVVIEACGSSETSSNLCLSSFSADGGLVGTATDAVKKGNSYYADSVEIVPTSTSMTISRSTAVCYCTSITIYYYA